MVLFYEGYCYLQRWGCAIFINDDLIFNSTGICNWLCLNWRAESLLFNIYLLFIFLVLQNCWKRCQKSFLRPLRRIALHCVVVSCGAGWGSCRISNTCTHKLNIRINGSMVLIPSSSFWRRILTIRAVGRFTVQFKRIHCAGDQLLGHDIKLIL